MCCFFLFWFSNDGMCCFYFQRTSVIYVCVCVSGLLLDLIVVWYILLICRQLLFTGHSYFILHLDLEVIGVCGVLVIFKLWIIYFFMICIFSATITKFNVFLLNILLQFVWFKVMIADKFECFTYICFYNFIIEWTESYNVSIPILFIVLLGGNVSFV